MLGLTLLHELWCARLGLASFELRQAVLKDLHPITPHIVERLQHLKLAKALDDVAFPHRTHEVERSLFRFTHGLVLNECFVSWHSCHLQVLERFYETPATCQSRASSCACPAQAAHAS